MPSTPSWPPGTEASSSVTATWRSPVATSIRVMRLPLRSVTHSLSSGPQVTSQGSARPDTMTVFSKCLVPLTTDSGPCCASVTAASTTAHQVDIHTTRIMKRQPAGVRSRGSNNRTSGQTHSG